MKIQVRNSVFETNSSSMHSIAIVKPENLKGTIDDYYGWQLTSTWLKPNAEVEVNSPFVIDDDSVDFERWPFRILSTMYEKARYAIASYGDEEHFQAISSICKKLTGHGLKRPTQHEDIFFDTNELSDGDEIPEAKRIPSHFVDWDREKEEWYWKDKDGNRTYGIQREVITVPYYGYVDHQSIGTLQNFLKKHNLSLEQFLKDPRYVVIIDGDEYCAWQKMFESGICLRENFIETGLRE